MIIFMGVVGSGKSVQGRKLADVLCLPWLSTGEFLRMLISGQTRKDMIEGKLLDDDQMISLVQKIFSVVDTEHEFILDGFPRTVGQADWLLNQLKYGQLKVSAVIHLVASSDTVKERLLSRGRPDDNADAIEVRLKEYDRAILPVLEELKNNNVKIYDINAEQNVEEVHAEILKSVKANMANDSNNKN